LLDIFDVVYRRMIGRRKAEVSGDAETFTTDYIRPLEVGFTTEVECDIVLVGLNVREREGEVVV
jgi:hypothetical protein